MAKKRSTRQDQGESINEAFQRVGAKIDSWKKQRDEIAADLQALIGSAQMELMLAELGTKAPSRSGEPGRSGRPKGYVMSMATRAKLKAAWARRKAAGKIIKRTISAEGRARIAAAQRARWAKVKRSDN